MSSAMAADPVTFTIYTLANMLTETTGGIDFSIPMYMGTGTAQTFNVADIMRVGALSNSLLGGIGTMLAGLGKGGNLLDRFGISGNGLTVLTRGSGTGLGALMASTDVSESGYAGNSDSSDIANKAKGDASETTEEQISAKEENSDEVKLKTVDGHIVDIYDLLTTVISGGSLTVKPESGTIWSNGITQ